jgi:large subunit ribosomal protein L3
MGKPHHPRRGSMQFWPRKRSRHSLVRVRSWAEEKQAKPLGFICFKAGMTHLLVNDNRPKSLTKGEDVSMPVTILECPPLNVFGISFYKKSLMGVRKFTSILAKNINKDLSKNIQLPKKQSKSIEDVKEFDDLRLLVHTNPKQTSTGVKKAKLLEIALGGSNEEKLNYAKENLGKELKIEDVFNEGNQVDVHGVTKGKGFQGTVKRFGVPIRQHKSEKVKRGIGNLGAWTPKRVDFRVPQSGKMGYHLRTDYNKQIIKISDKVEEVNPKKGIHNYGLVKKNYILIKGSIVGPKKRALLIIKSIRPNKKITKDAPEVSYTRQ